MRTQVGPELVHSVHIPVMGTAFTLDTPIKCARFGISSVMSIMDDELCEYTRQHYAKEYNYPYELIKKSDPDYRAKRITAYLNLANQIVNSQMEMMRSLPFEGQNDLVKYFELLPDLSPLKHIYTEMMACTDLVKKETLQKELKRRMRPGSLDVNVMTKIDRNTYTREGELLPEQFSDALAALRGYANSDLDSCIIFSAGFNRRLYAYIEQFLDFFPDEEGHIKKRVILKVSDYRSSLTQGRFLAKKGVWVSEHRVESGLNCGGHVFPSEGYVLGPILEEFKQKKVDLVQDLFAIANESLATRRGKGYPYIPYTRITVQGGIGTAKEQEFLMDYFKVDGTGWATPFLLVPEATTLDDKTRQLLADAEPEDTYVSSISPLGVKFNTVHGTESEKQRLRRIAEGKPGSPCPKGHLVYNTEFTEKPICTASTLYQRKKIQELDKMNVSKEEYEKNFKKITDKTCLCEDLGASSLINYGQENKRPLVSAVCPGPNIAYFSKISSLADMIGHIYGRVNLLNSRYRPNMFISELKMYIDYLAQEIQESLPKPTDRQISYFNNFKHNLFEGIDYYKTMIPNLTLENQSYRDKMTIELHDLKIRLERISTPQSQLA